jgi:hypothetical protein
MSARRLCRTCRPGKLYYDPALVRLMIYLGLQDLREGPDPFDDFEEFQYQRWLAEQAKKAAAPSP